MVKPLSNDLRERVVAFVEAGHSRRATAAHFRVSPSFVIKLMMLFRQKVRSITVQLAVSVVSSSIVTAALSWKEWPKEPISPCRNWQVTWHRQPAPAPTRRRCPAG